MIEALAIPTDNHLVLEYMYPGTKRKQHVSCANAAEAKRLVYFWNRLYITDRLTAWLHQRRRALSFSPFHNKAIEVEELLNTIGSYRELGLRQVCSIVSVNRAKISHVAPGSQSRHYGYFCNTILPILDFCDEMKGVSHE